MATASPLERHFKLRELQDAGLGDRTTLMKRIHDGTLPAVMAGNAYRIRESDLHFIAEPVGPVVHAATDAAVGLDDLAELTARMVSTWPRLSNERKRELSKLLAA